MDGNACVLIWVFAVLGSNGVLLPIHWLARIDATVLEYYGCIAEYEIHRAVDVTFAEELAIGVNIEGVLVSYDVAPIDHAMVSSNSKCYCLARSWSSCILKCYVPCDEACSSCGCRVGVKEKT